MALEAVVPGIIDRMRYQRPKEIESPLRARFAVHRGAFVHDWAGVPSFGGFQGILENLSALLDRRDEGWTGEVLWQTFRMLQSDELAARHKATGRLATIAVSETIRDELQTAKPEILDDTLITINPIATHRSSTWSSQLSDADTVIIPAIGTWSADDSTAA
jgi:hypothetical protein